MHITILSPGKLPIPSINGGAVETLITNFIDSNEKQMKIHIDVISSDISNDLSTNYNFASFHYINTKRVMYKAKKVFRFFINFLFKNIISNQFFHEVKKLSVYKNSEIIIYENCPNYILHTKKRSSCKYILHLHNDYLNKNNRINKKIISAFDSIIVVSNFIGQRLSWVDRNEYYKVKTVYNCIDSNIFNEGIQNINFLPEHFKIEKNDIVILYVGRIVKSKGVLELLKALKLINDIKIKILIVGSNWYNQNKKSKYLKSLINEAKSLQHDIHFTGYIENSKIQEIYKLSSVVVVPSISIEAAGLVILESRFMDKITVISNSGGMLEYIDNKKYIVDINSNFVTSLSETIYRAINDFKKNPIIKAKNVYHNKFGLITYYENMLKIIIDLMETSK